MSSFGICRLPPKPQVLSDLEISLDVTYYSKRQELQHQHHKKKTVAKIIGKVTLGLPFLVLGTLADSAKKFVVGVRAKQSTSHNIKDLQSNRIKLIVIKHPKNKSLKEKIKRLNFLVENSFETEKYIKKYKAELEDLQRKLSNETEENEKEALRLKIEGKKEGINNAEQTLVDNKKEYRQLFNILIDSWEEIIKSLTDPVHITHQGTKKQLDELEKKITKLESKLRIQKLFREFTVRALKKDCRGICCRVTT